MSQTKTTIPKLGGTPSINDGTNHAPAIMRFEYWIDTPLSIAKFYGEIKVNGRKYKMIDSGEPADPGCFKPDLVREDWCSLYKEHRRALKPYILKGMTPSQVRKLLKKKRNEKEM